MRFLVILALIVGAWLFVRSKSTPPPGTGSAPAAAASVRQAGSTSLLKQPIDRARDALKANEKRTSEGF